MCLLNCQSALFMHLNASLIIPADFRAVPSEAKRQSSSNMALADPGQYSVQIVDHRRVMHPGDSEIIVFSLRVTFPTPIGNQAGLLIKCVPEHKTQCSCDEISLISCFPGLGWNLTAQARE